MFKVNTTKKGDTIMNNEKITFRETFNVHYRSFKLLNKQCPHVFLSNVLYSIAIAIAPYIRLYCSALIINELAGNRDILILKKLVFITLLVTLCTEIIIAVCLRFKTMKRSTYWYDKNKLYTDKILSLDFYHLDNQKTHDLRYQILQNERMGGWGFGRIVILYCEDFTKSIIKIICSMAFTISLFTSPIMSNDPSLKFLSHPMFICLILLLLIMVTVVAPMLTTKANSYWTKFADDRKEGNRIFSYFGFLSFTRERAMDIRIYNQQDIGEHYLLLNKDFTPDSKLAACARGPMGLLIACSSMMTSLFTGIIYLYVCLKAWAKAFGIGSILQYVGAISSFTEGVSLLMQTLGDIKNNTYFIKNTFKFRDLDNDMYIGSLTTEKRADKNYEIEFENVSFKYPNMDEYALKNVSMKFKIGKRLAVIGENGSGKTTFIKLLCRLYDPTEGRILLNGIDIRKYKTEDYMQLFSVVFQDFKLLAFSLDANVAAKQNGNREKIIDCLSQAGFRDRLDTMTDGIDTYLYKEFSLQGVEVSGGEAQKIALARALYKNAPFMILDEPTAALDPLAEAEIYTKFNEIITDKTAIYISHRLSSCKFCDEIVVFDQGEIKQYGTHVTLLLEKDKKYYELWHAQAQYYN